MDLNRMGFIIGHKVIFDLLSHYKDEKNNMSQIVDYLSTVITFTESYVGFTKTEDSLMMEFIEKNLLEDNCEYFFHVMFNSPDKTTRLYCGKFVSNIVNKCFRIWGVCSEDPEKKDHPKIHKLKELLFKLMDRFIDILSDADCQKSWVRLEQYYLMLEDIGKSSKYQAMYFLEREPNFIGELCDLMLMDKSPVAEASGEKRFVMGGSAAQPYFKPLVSLASHLVMCCHTVDMPDDVPTLQKFKPEYQASDSVALPLPKKYVLSKEAKDLFTHKELMNQVMKLDWSVEQYGMAIAHLIYGDKKLSKAICAMTLKTISVSDQGKIEGYLKIIERISQTQDFDKTTGQSL